MTQDADKPAFKFTIKLIQENDIAAIIDQLALMGGIYIGVT